MIKDIGSQLYLGHGSGRDEVADFQPLHQDYVEADDYGLDMFDDPG